MPNSIKLIFVLSVICIVSATSLSYVYNSIAGPIIEERSVNTALEILNEMLPGADDYEFIKDEATGKTLYYTAIKNSETFGVAIPANAPGFGGAVELMIISDMTGNITAVRVLSQTETPGYGDRILTEPWFIEQYIDMNLVEDEFSLNKTVDALAGATVTSSAANKAINNAAQFFQNNIVDGGSN